jgi:hypothetical protein
MRERKAQQAFVTERAAEAGLKFGKFGHRKSSYCWNKKSQN